MNSSMTKQFVLAILIGILSIASGARAQAASGTPITSDLHDGTANPRLVRILHGEAKGTIVAAVRDGAVYESRDDGETFSKLADIPFLSGTRWQCCGTLFELPRSVGELRAGTLLQAATFCAGTIASIDVYSSSDGGRTWTYHSTPVRRGHCNSGIHDGLWEPQFEVDSSDSLVMFWSDETDPCCSQKLAQIRSVDGVTWQDAKNTVASDIHADRPGMAVVSKLPSGIYFMTYELCGPAKCTVFYRTSPDGWNFGPPSNTGRKIETVNGEYFEHAPRNLWIDTPANRWIRGFPPADGALLVVGQLLYDKNGDYSPESGHVLFVNHTRDASGKWELIPAPVKVNIPADAATPDGYNTCQNYSSALLPVRDGSALLEMASDWNAIHVCTSYFASEPVDRLSFHDRPRWGIDRRLLKGDVRE
jgi:hypothetical protein